MASGGTGMSSGGGAGIGSIRPGSVALGAGTGGTVVAPTGGPAASMMTATMVDGRALPGWLSFDPGTGKFSGTPPRDADPVVNIRIVTRDRDGREDARTVILNTADFLKSSPSAPPPATVVFTIDSNEYKVGDNTFTSDHVPYLDAQNRAMVPLLAFAKAQGADARMEWNASDQSITIFQANRTTIKVVVGQMSYWLNGTQIPMDTAAVMKDGEIFLPVRAVGQAMGKIISWDNATRSVIITP